MNKDMSRGAGSAFGGKKIVFTACAIILLAAGCHSSTQQSSDQTQPVQNSAPASTSTQPSSAGVSMWQGTLKTSDNAKQGNLMLVTDQGTVYINTSRDYSDLVGKQVNVSYQGTRDSFELGDITAK